MPAATSGAAGLASTPACGSRREARRHRRARRLQRQAALVYLHLGVRVDCAGQMEVLQEARLEVVQPAVAVSELRLQRLPRDGLRALQDVQAVGEPAINVEGERVVAQSLYGGLFDRHGMPLELLKEGLRQPHRVHEE